MINEDVQVDFHCVEVVDGQQNEESYTYPGKFYVKNEKLYVKFDESPTVNEGNITTILKLDEYEMNITRTSDKKNVMYYSQGSVSNGVYSTPYGDFDMTVKTEKYLPILSEDSLQILLEYTVELNGKQTSKRSLSFFIS